MTQPMQTEDTIVEEMRVIVVPTDNTGSGHGNGAGGLNLGAVTTALDAQLNALGSMVGAVRYFTELLDNAAEYRSLLDKLATDIDKLSKIKPVLSP
jgi:hypothetical protein